MWEYRELGFGRVVLERLLVLEHLSKSIQGLAGRALNLEEISGTEIKIWALPSTKR